MARVCQITGKTTMSGHKVSHSNIKTKRKFYPNLQYKRFWSESEQRWVELRVTPKGMKTINKLGLDAAVKRAKEAGFIA
ncbi:MAG: 50S ribosomal protein L28 [Flavobacteriales bacterium]|jgi:large subunit ribosomal protein L28